ncbi:hypothetical protein B0I33_101392 [Prauserella shujinwangii]|uniref:Uncharacterized protein n=1 Tax=Prauserella shujinwangii TaxID=1453103 RepID=A0A2T0M3E8_9PSEU|nr:hypothetical protein B0I33_101392 [Prauserella shujinwangii]
MLLATTACGQAPVAEQDGGAAPALTREPVLPESGTERSGGSAAQPAPPIGDQPGGRRPADGGAQPEPGPPPEPGPSPEPGVPPDQLDDRALPEEYPRQVSVSDGGRRLSVVAEEGGCGRASVELTEQSARRVVLTLVETRPAEPKMCTMDMRYPLLSVTLDRPLGDRELVLRHERRGA